MTCDDFRPDYLLYAMGTLSDPELSELRTHLASGCETCASGLRDARLLAFTIGAGVEGPEPPRHLRGRVLAAIGEGTKEKAGWFPAWAGVAGAAALMLVALGLFVFQRQHSDAQLSELRSELESNRAQTAAMREAFALIRAPDTREVSFGEGKPASPPRGRVFFHGSGILLIAANLAPPPPGKTYEMWIIRGGKAAPAGLFPSDAQGNAVHLYRTATPAATTDVVAVTLETSAGVLQPTSTPVIVAPLT